MKKNAASQRISTFFNIAGILILVGAIICFLAAFTTYEIQPFLISASGAVGSLFFFATALIIKLLADIEMNTRLLKSDDKLQDWEKEENLRQSLSDWLSKNPGKSANDFYSKT